MHRTTSLYSALAAGLLLAGTAYAQAPTGAPTGATGQCKDGTYSTQATKKGACRGHKGVQAWYTAADAAAQPVKAATAVAAPASVPAAAPAAAPSVPAAPAAAKRQPAQFTPSASAAPGGGPGMVWANGKVYHCPNDKWYGKTKSGSYMTEADAKAKGLHADHGRACTN